MESERPARQPQRRAKAKPDEDGDGISLSGGERRGVGLFERGQAHEGQGSPETRGEMKEILKEVQLKKKVY